MEKRSEYTRELPSCGRNTGSTWQHKPFPFPLAIQGIDIERKISIGPSAVAT